MERVANLIGKIGMYVALATFIAMVLNLVIYRLINNQPILDISVTKGIVNAVIVAITIIVVAVPEGLPLAVTISLAYSVNQMRKENNLVRRLEAAETMGGANEILTDKTGTLTQNKMSVVQFYCEGKTHNGVESVSANMQDMILKGCSLNSNSHIIIDDKTFQEKRIGNQTECALLDFVNRSLLKQEKQERTYENYRKNNKLLKMYPFNSTTKKMTVVVELEHMKMVRVFTKGASENIIDDCDRVLETNSDSGIAVVKDFEGSAKTYVKETVIRNMAMNALRTIAMGYKDMTYEQYREVQNRLDDKESNGQGDTSDEEFKSQDDFNDDIAANDPQE